MNIRSVVLTMPTLSSMSLLTMSFLQKWQLNLLILSHFELTLTFETVKEYSFLQKNEENPEEVKTMKYLSVRNLVRFASCVHNDYRTWVRTSPGLVHSYTNCCLKTNILEAYWNCLITAWSELVQLVVFVQNISLAEEFLFQIHCVFVNVGLVWWCGALFFYNPILYH